MPRHRNASYHAVHREPSVQRYEQLVADINAAHRSIDLGACPNDGATMVDGKCPAVGCMFRIHVAAPPVVDHRVTFNRQWFRTGGARPQNQGTW